MPGPWSDDAWTLNSVVVRDHCRPWLNEIWRRAVQVWDQAATGIRFNYQNRGYTPCDRLDKVDGAIVICSHDKVGQIYGEAFTWDDHGEITAARIWTNSLSAAENDFTLEAALHEFGHAIGMNHYNDTIGGRAVSIMHADAITDSATLMPKDLQALERMGYMVENSGPEAQKKRHRKRRRRN